MFGYRVNREFDPEIWRALDFDNAKVGHNIHMYIHDEMQLKNRKITDCHAILVTEDEVVFNLMDPRECHPMTEVCNQQRFCINVERVFYEILRSFPFFFTIQWTPLCVNNIKQSSFENIT